METLLHEGATAGKLQRQPFDFTKFAPKAADTERNSVDTLFRWLAGSGLPIESATRLANHFQFQARKIEALTERIAALEKSTAPHLRKVEKR